MATVIELISVSEAAEILDCGAYQVHRLIQEERLQAYRVIGKQKLYLEKIQVQQLKEEGWRKIKPRTTSSKEEP